MISGKLLRDAIISGSNNIANHKNEVDRLNVFPVPDGDTGTNMSMTIANAVGELQVLPDDATVETVSRTTASALLRGARGNSGVITSLLFRGFSKALKGKRDAGAADLIAAVRKGVDAAYKAVMKPTEGTILTVAREAAEYCEDHLIDESDPVIVWESVCKIAADSLLKTPELLPVLKKAGVVDAGGQGLVYIYEGMLSVFKDGTIIENQSVSAEVAQNQPAMPDLAGADFSDFDLPSEQNPYCTEFIVNRSGKGEGDAIALRAYLESIGDSVVVVDDDDIIKAHVHTARPGDAMNEAIKYGYLTKMKIENMVEQLATLQAGERAAQAQASAEEQNIQPEENFEYIPADPNTQYDFVSVCAGEGVKALFVDLGVTKVVSGGQTMNPSTDDILRAVHSVPAKTVFVLPNNKNIIMAAEQTIKLADREVIVIPTKTIPQGITAMLSFDPEAGANDNAIAMTKAMEAVQTGQITYAARDSEYEGHQIKQGELLALENGKLAFTDTDLYKSALKLIKMMVHRDSSFVTLITGEDLDEPQSVELEEYLREKLPPDLDIAIVPGGQPVYYLIISVE